MNNTSIRSSLKIFTRSCLLITLITVPACHEGYLKVTRSGHPEPGLKFSTEPSGPTAGTALKTQPVITIKNSFGNTSVAGPNSELEVTISLASGSGTLSGTTTVKAVKGIATFTNLAISETGIKTLKASASIGTATSAEFTLGVDFELAAVTTSSTYFCPRTYLSAGSVTPSTATTYCLLQNSEDVSGCTFAALPLPTAIRSTSESLNASLWFKDSSGTLINSSPLKANILSYGPTQLPAARADWLAAIKSTSVTAPQLDELLCRVDDLTHPPGGPRSCQHQK